MTTTQLHPHTFSKSEHLCGDIRLGLLFEKGQAFIVYPFRVVYLVAPKTDLSTVSVMVSAPKKRFKRAVKRNRLKRLTREAYRLQKADLVNVLDAHGLQMHVAFGYVSNDMLEFEYMHRKMYQALCKLIDCVLLNSDSGNSVV